MTVKFKVSYRTIEYLEKVGVYVRGLREQFDKMRARLDAGEDPARVAMDLPSLQIMTGLHRKLLDAPNLAPHEPLEALLHFDAAFDLLAYKFLPVIVTDEDDHQHVAYLPNPETYPAVDPLPEGADPDGDL